MITAKSRQMLQRSFDKVRYRFQHALEPRFSYPVGVYVHVPFCPTTCSFCPFYKEKYEKDLAERYVSSLLREIDQSPLEGPANWVYLGGGTPNTLTPEQLGRIKAMLAQKVRCESWGIELLPALVDEAYLQGLRDLGFTRVSMGIESFSSGVMAASGRCLGNSNPLHLFEAAAGMGLKTSMDLMIGLPGQKEADFLQDIRLAGQSGSYQVTIYPYMNIRGLGKAPSLPEKRQFRLIERAMQHLEQQGYRRISVWVAARGTDIYDSSRDELIGDYVGFGPAAFSCFGGTKQVNPELAPWLRGLEQGERQAFVAPEDETARHWRRFARMIYDLKLEKSNTAPGMIRGFTRVLAWCGFSRGERLTRKGRMFAHALTKGVVESLPFPIQNPGCISNYNEYLAYKQASATVPSPATVL